MKTYCLLTLTFVLVPALFAAGCSSSAQTHVQTTTEVPTGAQVLELLEREVSDLCAQLFLCDTPESRRYGTPEACADNLMTTSRELLPKCRPVIIGFVRCLHDTIAETCDEPASEQRCQRLHGSELQGTICW